MPDGLKQNKPALDLDARVILGRQLRNYYDRMRHVTVSDSLAQLLREFEIGTAQESEGSNSPQVDAASQAGG